MPRLYEIFLNEFENDYQKLNPKKLTYFYFEKAIFELADYKKSESRISLLKASKFSSDKKKLVIFFVYLISFLPKSTAKNIIILGHRFKGLIK